MDIMTGEERQFLTHVSHELRTPMNAINAFLELASESDNIEEIRGYLKDIRRSSRELMLIINEELEGSLQEYEQLQNEIKALDTEPLKQKEEKTLELDVTIPVLVVDDNDVNLKVTRAFLEQYGIHADMVLSGQEAIQMAGSRSYGLILMDCMMPEMDGKTTMDAIRERYGRYRQVPFVALTANAVRGAKESLMEQGFDDYLSKPIYKERLEDLLKKWMNSPIKGVRLQMGIDNCGEDEEIYHSILQFIAENGHERSEDLKRFLAEEDFENYTIAVHALKSTLANIGAMEASQMAKDLEMAGKQGRYEEIRQGHGPLLEVYEELLVNIKAYLENTQNQMSGNMENQKRTDVLDDDLMEDSEEMSREELGFVLEDVASLLEEFRYGEAESVVQEILEFHMKGSSRSCIQEIHKDITNLRIGEALDKIRAF